MPDKKLTDNLSNNSPILSNSLTDAEIKKALELCQLEDSEICETCPLGKFYPYCDDVLAPATVDLINRLQAENERLRGDIPLIVENVEITEDTLKNLKHQRVVLVPDEAEIKAEAYKECIEKVKKELSFGKYIQPEQLDNLLKEMAGDENEREN